MNKTATVKSVQANGMYKEFYKWEVEMDSGDVGENLTKSEKPDYFIVGEKVEYEYVSGKFPKIKRAYKAKSDANLTQSGRKDDNVQLYIIRQSSLKAAIDFNNIIMGDTKPTIDDICHDAEHFTKYVMNGLAGDKTNTGDTSNTEEKPPPPEETNDLPF